MKSSFREFYQKSDAEFEALWRDSIIAFDASAILNLYFYSERTAQTFLSVMQVLKDRIWLPFQAGLEYQRNRLGVLSKVAKEYEETKKSLAAIQRKMHAHSQPPFLESDLMEKFDSVAIDISAALDRTISEIESRHSGDSIREQLDVLFKTRIGKGFTDDQLKTIFGEGKERYKAKIPPGYKDESEKPGNDMFGDLVIWRELLEKAKTEKKPVIFVTDDAKEDWWLIHCGKTIGPRTELLREFSRETSQQCHLYSSESFLRHADRHLNASIDQASILEVHEAALRDRLFTFERGFEDIDLPFDKELDGASALIETLDMDADSDEFAEAMANYERLAAKKSADVFIKRVYPTLSPGAKKLRAELTSDIANLLQECRSCGAWGERGEYKLPSWLEYVEESVILYTSIPKLKKIKANLDELLCRLKEQGSE